MVDVKYTPALERPTQRDDRRAIVDSAGPVAAAESGRHHGARCWAAEISVCAMYFAFGYNLYFYFT